jgi:SAM-dependent methyltransferase
MSAEALDLVNASVASVVAMNVLDIVDDPGAVMTEIARVLQPGGRFIHLHDRVPDVVHITHAINARYPGHVLLPFVSGQRGDPDRLLKAFQLVDAAVMEGWRTSATVAWEELQEVIADPLGYSAEHLTDISDAIKILSHDLNMLEPAITLPFGRLLNTVIAAAGEQVGLAVVEQGVVSAEKRVLKASVRAEFESRGMHLEGMQHLVRHEQGAIWEIIPPASSSVKEKYLRLGATMTFLVVAKPPA